MCLKIKFNNNNKKYDSIRMYYVGHITWDGKRNKQLEENVLDPCILMTHNNGSETGAR